MGVILVAYKSLKIISSSVIGILALLEQALLSFRLLSLLRFAASLYTLAVEHGTGHRILGRLTDGKHTVAKAISLL